MKLITSNQGSYFEILVDFVSKLEAGSVSDDFAWIHHSSDVLCNIV